MKTKNISLALALLSSGTVGLTLSQGGTLVKEQLTTSQESTLVEEQLNTSQENTLVEAEFITSQESTLVEEQYNEWQFTECQRDAIKLYAESLDECLDEQSNEEAACLEEKSLIRSGRLLRCEE